MSHFQSRFSGTLPLKVQWHTSTKGSDYHIHSFNHTFRLTFLDSMILNYSPTKYFRSTTLIQPSAREVRRKGDAVHIGKKTCGIPSKKGRDTDDR